VSDTIGEGRKSRRPERENGEICTITTTLLRNQAQILLGPNSTRFATTVASTMPHPRRVFVAGVSAHIYHRAHNCTSIFGGSDDFATFIHLVHENTMATDVSVHGFAVMNTHYHLLVTPNSTTGLPRAMKKIHGGYVRYFNRKHNRLGTAWNGRYKARAIKDERYWLTCLRYIEQNPVSAGIVTNPDEYEWSSYRIHALGETSTWIVSHPVYDALAVTPLERQMKYREICADGLPLDFELP
jgi:REP-associated tyrosine transposase